MTIEKVDNLEELSVDKLPSQFRDKLFMEEFTKALAGEVQELEDASFQVILDRWLTTAIGVQLDLLGEIVGETRAGRTDEDYRVFLQIRILRNLSQGETETIISVVKVVTGTDQIIVEDRGNAKIKVTYIDAALSITNQEVAEGVRSIRAAGVGIRVLESVSDYFGFSDDSGSLGFGDSGDSTVGGRFSSVAI